jgi:hypothetical protein
VLGVQNETQPLHQHQTDRAACTKAARIDNLNADNSLYFDSLRFFYFSGANQIIKSEAALKIIRVYRYVCTRLVYYGSRVRFFLYLSRWIEGSQTLKANNGK